MRLAGAIACVAAGLLTTADAQAGEPPLPVGSAGGVRATLHRDHVTLAFRGPAALGDLAAVAELEHGRAFVTCVSASGARCSRSGSRL